jgi:hypothetical protein
MYCIDPSLESLQEFRQSLQLPLLGELLTDQEIETICTQLGHTWRDRQLPPAVTLRSMVYRGLHPDKTISHVVDHLVASGQVDASVTDSAWCQARSRLPEALGHELLLRSADRVANLAAGLCHFSGRPVVRIDGSTLSMPDAPALVEAFGYAPCKHGHSRFPVARITFIVLAGAEAVWDYRLGPYRSSEESQLYQMWEDLPKEAICLMDRKFCSFYNLAKLQQLQVDVLCPLHQRRDPQKLIRQGKKLGRDEWLVPLDLSREQRRKYDDESLPERLWVRLIRVHRTGGRGPADLWLVTTLVNRRRYPRKKVANLYRQRWPVETRIGSVKTTLELAVLRSQTPANVRREVAATLLGHNLLWTLMHQAARQTDTPADRISFARAIGVVEEFAAPLRFCRRSDRPKIYRLMLQRIASHKNPYRPGRVEPRKVKRDRTRYPYLHESRQEARRRCLS